MRSASTRKPASAWCRRSARSTCRRCRSARRARPQIGERVVVGGAGGRTRSLAGHIAAKQEFAGYWEYVLDEAIFTYPAHPNWGGTALISAKGELIGIGSLQLERERDGKNEHLNMIVPIDLLKPVLDDLRKFGRVNKPARPWLGRLFDRDRGQGRRRRHRAQGAGGARRTEDRRRRAGGRGRAMSPRSPSFYRKVWSLGAGRRRSAADAVSRRRDVRRAGEFLRPREIPQGAADALDAAPRTPVILFFVVDEGVGSGSGRLNQIFHAGFWPSCAQLILLAVVP